MVTQQNKKLTLGILLTFIICIGSAILAAYSTGPYGNYPNPGIHPGMIGPGTFNDSGMANPQWEIPGKLNIDKNATVKGTLNIDKGLIIGNPAGGDKGTGTINVESVYVNGSRMDGGEVHVDRYYSSVSVINSFGCNWKTIERFNVTLPPGGIITSLTLKAEVNPSKDSIQAQLKIICLEYPTRYVESGVLLGFPDRGWAGYGKTDWSERMGSYIPKNINLTSKCTLFTRPSGGVVNVEVQGRETRCMCNGLCGNGIRNPVLIVTYVII